MQSADDIIDRNEVTEHQLEELKLQVAVNEEKMRRSQRRELRLLQAEDIGALLQEMTASGQVQTGNHSVVTKDGAELTVPVTRVGLFNAAADGKYLKFIPETGRLIEYTRQPAARYLTGVAALTNGSSGVVPVAIDPVRGQLLDILTQAPDLFERIAQGGAIGYAIISSPVMLAYALVRRFRRQTA